MKVGIQGENPPRNDVKKCSAVESMRKYSILRAK